MTMAKVIAGMTTSVDGFVADQKGGVDRLYPDLAELRGTAYMNDLIGETGSVIMGRRTFEMADPDSYAGDYEYQVPIFVVTHRPPPVVPKQSEHLTFTFVTDGVESAVAQARTAAGDRAVQVVGGAGVVQQLLSAGLVEDVTLCAVSRAPLAKLHRRMRLWRRVGRARTSLRFRVLRPSSGG